MPNVSRSNLHPMHFQVKVNAKVMAPAEWMLRLKALRKRLRPPKWSPHWARSPECLYWMVHVEDRDLDNYCRVIH